MVASLITRDCPSASGVHCTGRRIMTRSSRITGGRRAFCRRSWPCRPCPRRASLPGRHAPKEAYKPLVAFRNNVGALMGIAVLVNAFPRAGWRVAYHRVIHGIPVDAIVEDATEIRVGIGV